MLKYTKKLISFFLALPLFIFCFSSLTVFAWQWWPWPSWAIDSNVSLTGIDWTQNNDNDNFVDLIDQTIEPIQDKIETNIAYGWVDGIVIFVIDIFKTYVFPIIIILAVLTGIFWFFEIMTSNTEDKRKKWMNYFIRGVVGIIIFVSAEFIFNNLSDIITTITSNNDPLNAPSRNVYAWEIFNKIAYPFLKLGMYIVMGGLFLLVLVKGVELVTNPSDKAPEQWRNIVISAAMGIIVILVAKTLVEAVYSSQSKILGDTNTIFVWDGILDTSSQNYSTIFNVINYLLGFMAFAVLCIIIYQWYLMLFESNTDEGIKKMRKNLLYMFAGLLLIWLSYIIVNVAIIN